MKALNQYALLVPQWLYEACPKAVFAALAVSPLWQFIDAEGPSAPGLDTLLLDEWRKLHSQGIVPQAPPRKVTP